MNDINWQRVRKKYSVFNQNTYLRTNGGGPFSEVYLEAIGEVSRDAAKSGRIWGKYWEFIDKTRDEVSKMMNCESEEVAFTHSVSLGMNHLSSMLSKGMRILSFKDEYPSNTIPFLEKGFDVTLLSSESNGNINPQIVKEAAKDADVLIVSHVEYRTGYRHNLKILGEICEDHDLIFIVDATQSAGVFSIDFKDCGADALVFSTHKWLNSGYSMACMIVSSDLIKKYPPRLLGWRSVKIDDDHNIETYSVKKNASVFELGHPDFVSIYALFKQLEFVNEISVQRIESRIVELCSYLRARCDEVGLRTVNNFSLNNQSGIIVISISDETAESLKRSHIDFTYRDGKALIAISYYNNTEDIDRFIEIAVS